MNRRRALMSVAMSNARLPKEYQEVEWVGTNGLQNIAKTKIDTGAVCTTKPRIVTDYYHTGQTNASIAEYIAATSGTTIMFRLASGNLRFTYGGKSSSYAVIGVDSPTYYVWYHIDHSQATKLDGTTLKNFSVVDWSGNTASISIFSGDSGNAAGRFKEFFIYDGTTLVRDLVPCYRKSDSRIGFYDLVGEQFYTNAGDANVLTKGANV